MSKATIEITGIKITIEDEKPSSKPKEDFAKGSMADAYKQAKQEHVNNIREQILNRNRRVFGPNTLDELDKIFKELFSK